jgi:large subunit ribosomal protein L32e
MAAKKPAISRKLLKLRKRAKQKKPEFLRSESWRYSKMSESWRRPRGLDHKMRRKIKGWPPMVSTGYKGPKVARGLHPSGLREVMVHNVEELSLVDPSVQAARIGHTVGKKKRTLIIAAAREKKIRILNPGITETSEEPGEALAEGEEPVVEAEAETKKPRGGRFGRKKPAKEVAAPAEEEEKVEKPKKRRKTAKSAETAESEEGKEEVEEQ